MVDGALASARESVRPPSPGGKGPGERWRSRAGAPGGHTAAVDEDRPPICPACGVTMVPAELSAGGARGREWECLECEETGEPDRD